MAPLSQIFSGIGLVLNTLGAFCLIVPELPEGNTKQFINKNTVKVRRIEIAYYRFMNEFSFESDPRVQFHNEPTPAWITKALEKDGSLTDDDKRIILALLSGRTWRWTNIDRIQFRIEEQVELPDPEMYEIWSKSTFVFTGAIGEEGINAYYPANDWTKKQLSDNKKEVISQLYTYIGAIFLLLGFIFQFVSKLL